MKNFPQLRLRSEYSFRNAYGTTDRLVERLKEIGCRTAGLVDTKGTWGHVPWEKSCGDALQPAFGSEFRIEDEEGFKPVCWALAEDIAQFYRFCSDEKRDWSTAKGVIRFAGDALTDPEMFDYVDVNPASDRDSVYLAAQTGKPLVLTCDNDYPAPADYENFMAWADDKKMTPQWVLAPDEMRDAFPFLTDEEYHRACMTAYEVEERLQGVKLRKAPMISAEGSLWELIERGREYRLGAGHIPAWTDEYEQRLQREFELIQQKEFDSYFIVVADLIWYAKGEMLVGPGRGSSAGSLVCYLLRITEVDPIPNGLLFERFIDINRADLPDIDIDFNDKKRHLCFEYLENKYGRDKVARIGSINKLKPRSVMAHIAKKMGINRGATFPVLNVLIEYSSGDSRYGKGLEDTLTNTQPGRDFMKQYPEAAIMGALENHASHTGVHAAGTIVANVPVIEYCAVVDGVAQLDKHGADYLNLLKIDVLGLRTLGVIEDTGCVTPEELYALDLSDPKVFEVYNQQKYSGVFQFEGAAQRTVANMVPIDSFQKIDHVTALARPGPLGGGAAQHYTQRNLGLEEIEYKHPSMADYLSETLGVVLYQEQVMRIVREIGNFSWQETSTIRKAMSGSKGKEFFDQRGKIFEEGAARLGINAQQAYDIWQEICSFGAWGMNKSHTTSYAVISYWCAWMKAYHPIDYAAACLRSAKDDEQTIEILRELRDEGVRYIPFDPDLSEANWAAKNGAVVGGFSNLIGIGPVKAASYVQKRNGSGLTPADLDRLAKLKTKFDDLSPAYTRWHDIYDNPDKYGIHGSVKRMAELKDEENAVVIVKLVKKERRDDNEAARIAKRGGRVIRGQALFLDLFCVDDSISKPTRLRISKRDWFRFGVPLADRAVDNQDWFLVRGVWMERFQMMQIKKIKPLNNTEIFR